MERKQAAVKLFGPGVGGRSGGGKGLDLGLAPKESNRGGGSLSTLNVAAHWGEDGPPQPPPLLLPDAGFAGEVFASSNGSVCSHDGGNASVASGHGSLGSIGSNRSYRTAGSEATGLSTGNLSTGLSQRSQRSANTGTNKSMGSLLSFASMSLSSGTRAGLPAGSSGARKDIHKEMKKKGASLVGAISNW